MKLSPVRGVVAGKRVVMVDDSIVRGTTSKRIVRMLREAGATEVHVRISSPPITHPCFMGSIRQQKMSLLLLDTRLKKFVSLLKRIPSRFEQRRTFAGDWKIKRFKELWTMFSLFHWTISDKDWRGARWRMRTNKPE